MTDGMTVSNGRCRGVWSPLHRLDKRKQQEQQRQKLRCRQNLQQRRPQHQNMGLFLCHGAVGHVVFAALAFAAFLVVSSAAEGPRNVAAKESSATGALPGEARDGIVSVPLIPHRAQKARRRLEQQRRGLSADEGAVADRPHRYPRWNLFEEDGDVDRDESIAYGNSSEAASLRRRREKGGDDSQPEQVAALFQGYGTHYADLWCGSPPQRQTVIVDTGSGVTAFPCRGCNNCGVPDYHASPLFDPESSSSYKKLKCKECLRGSCSGGKNGQCSISMSYAEGSRWSAYEVSDTCYVGGLHYKAVDKDDGSDNDWDPFHAPGFAFDMKFGCQNVITGLFKTQLADGIMGMDIASAAYWQQMYNAKVIKRKAFSLCFSRQDSVSRDGTEAGAMTLGGMDERLHDSDVVYTNGGSSSGRGFFNVHLRKIHLRATGGGDSALSADDSVQVMTLDIQENSFGRVIVDSGTTDTYFPRKMSSVFGKAFKEMSGKPFNHDKMKVSADEIDKLPTILFQLSGDESMNKAAEDAADGRPVVGLAKDLDKDHPYDVILAVPPTHYCEYDGDEGVWVNRFYTSEGSGAVLGANSMMGHDVFFDIENGRIGWAESSCDYTTMVKKYADGDVIGPGGYNGASSKGRTDQQQTESGDEGDGGGEEEITGGVSAAEISPGFTCTDLKCQLGFVAGIVGTILISTVAYLRRRGGNGMAEYQAAELELQPAVGDVGRGGVVSAVSSDDADEDDGEYGVRYRDHPAGKRGRDMDEVVDVGDDEAPTGEFT